MTDAEFEQSNIEGDDGPPPSARVSTWIAPAPPPDSRRSHRLRNSALVGAAVVTLAAGLGHGRVASKSSSPPVSASPSSMSTSSRFGSNSLGTSASSSSTATGSGLTEVSSIAHKVDPGTGGHRHASRIRTGRGCWYRDRAYFLGRGTHQQPCDQWCDRDQRQGYRQWQGVLGHRCRIRHHKRCCSPPAQRRLRTAHGVHRKPVQRVRGRNCRRNRKRRRHWRYAECHGRNGHRSQPVDHRN